MEEFAGYLRDLRNSKGVIIGVQRKSTLIEIETSNKTQLKLGRKHLIQFEVLSPSEGKKAYDEWANKVKGISPEVKKAGRPAKK